MRSLAIFLAFYGLTLHAQTAAAIASHPDYVRDAKTAERISEAILVGMFGKSRVAAQLPLHAHSASEDVWLVEGTPKRRDGYPQIGGQFGVWVNKHTGCVSVMERMK